MLKIKNLRVEHLAELCVTDNQHPRFFFYLESDKKNVTLKKAVLSLNSWTSETDSQISLTYNGPKLLPFSCYTATILATDNYGENAKEKIIFETGRFDTPWKADWITDGTYKFKKKKTSPETMTFRKSFSKKKQIESARIYSTALGIYELTLNGKKVGKDYFAPGFTSYKNQLQYQTYDITNMLHETNELIAVVGGGWAVGSFTYKRQNKNFAKRQAFLAEIRIRYTDGTEELIASDETWQVTREGNYYFTEFYDGEIYDATINLNAALWRNAEREIIKINPEIMAQTGAPVRAMERLTPSKVLTSPSGKRIYDFGQNFAGVVEASISSSEGQTIVFKHAEILMNGELFTEPLRTAKQTAVYICRKGKQHYSPRMTYMGFRYVEVSGIDEKDIELKALVLYSQIEERGHFSCSHEMLNRLQKNIRWSAKSNFVDIPTDCPQRDERMGWTGDIALFGSTACFNFDMSRFLEKWLSDVKAEQGRGGGIPMTVPWVKVPGQWEIMITMAVDHWGDACILVPWAEYKASGNIGLLEKMYPVMKRYMKACLFWSRLFSVGKHRRIWKLLHHYGDWLAPGKGLWNWMAKGKWTATACMANSCSILSQIASLLGHNDEAHYYENLNREISRAYRELLMTNDCRIKKEFQTGYVLPLYYQMLSDEDKEKTAAHLSRMIKENGYRIGTGFPGTPYILFALSDNGYEEDAFKMLLNETAPSWLFQVKSGGTTVWERWDALREDGTSNTGANDGTNGMVSFNHYAAGAVGDFLYRRIAGIEPVSGGYKSFRIKPLIGGGITNATAWLNSPYGRIFSQWEINDGIFSINIQVPVNSTCHLFLPDGQNHTLPSGEYSFEILYQENQK